jgi:hypothetical protein
MKKLNGEVNTSVFLKITNMHYIISLQLQEKKSSHVFIIKWVGQKAIDKGWEGDFNRDTCYGSRMEMFASNVTLKFQPCVGKCTSLANWMDFKRWMMLSKARRQPLSVR